MAKGRGSLTVPTTRYCDQKALEVTAETGSRTSICQKNNINKGDKFYQLFKCLNLFSISKAGNINIELYVIFLNIRVHSTVLFISAANF